MARYIAVQPIHIGGALAFAPGHEVPAGHVERHHLRKYVTEVADDHRGDAPELAVPPPDNTPPPPPRLALLDDEPAAADEVAAEEPAVDTRSEPASEPSSEPAPDSPEPPRTARAKKSSPATGATTTNTVTEG